MSEQLNNLDPAIVSEDPVVPSRPRGVKSIEIDDELMDDIRELVRSQASAILLNIVTDLHEADIAEIINRLDAEDREFVFNLLEPSVAAAVLLELNAEVREPLLEPWTSEKITSFVDLLPSDDAADLIAELPPSVAEKVLRSMPVEDSSDVKELMQYRPDSAGGIMGTEFISV
jgi:magnesium transporter